MKVLIRYVVSNASTEAPVRGRVLAAAPAKHQWLVAAGCPPLTRAAIEFAAELDVGWVAGVGACVDVGVFWNGMLDLLIRAPWLAGPAEISVGRRRCPGETLEAPEVGATEVSAALSSPLPLPHEALIGAEAIIRIDAILERLASTVPPANVVTCLGIADNAAQATHPYDRVVALWSALETLVADPDPVDVVESRLTRGRRSRPVARHLIAADPEAVRVLLRTRWRLAANPGVRPRLRTRLERPHVRTAASRLATALASAYALRNGIAHGDLARYPATERRAAWAADRVLWLLLGMLIEERMVGRSDTALPGPTAWVVRT